MNEIELINHGFVPPVITPDHYILGGEQVPKDIISPDGQWLDSCPPNRNQFNRGFDTDGCTVFGTLNAIEILKTKNTGGETVYSPRFTYIASETRPPGNDPQVIAESVRKAGIVGESELPFSDDIDSLDKFIAISDARLGELILLGLRWIAGYDFLHEWVFNTGLALIDKQKLMIEALQYSPVGVSVRAWQQRPNGRYFKDIGQADCHWTTCVGYVLGEYWIIFDSYPDSVGSEIKLLEWDYDFGFAKRFYLKEKISSPPSSVPILAAKISWFSRIIAFITNYLQHYYA